MRPNVPTICRKRKKVSRLSYYAAHYKPLSAFLNVNKLFKTITITIYAQNISLVLLNNSFFLLKYGSNYLYASNGTVAVNIPLHYKYVRVFLHLNKLFKNFTLRLDAPICFFPLLNTLKVS